MRRGAETKQRRRDQPNCATSLEAGAARASSRAPMKQHTTTRTRDEDASSRPSGEDDDGGGEDGGDDDAGDKPAGAVRPPGCVGAAACSGDGCVAMSTHGGLAWGGRGGGVSFLFRSPAADGFGPRCGHPHAAERIRLREINVRC